LVSNILQSIFFYVPQQKESHKGLEVNNERLDYPFRTFAQNMFLINASEHLSRVLLAAEMSLFQAKSKYPGH